LGLILFVSAIVPWYIMTSPLTEAKTKKFFQDKQFFGIQEKNVIFFNQVHTHEVNREVPFTHHLSRKICPPLLPMAS
jgi:UDP-N-acetylglucosamine pyrophosphorylase